MGEVIFLNSKEVAKGCYDQALDQKAQSSIANSKTGGDQWRALIERGCRLAAERFASPTTYQNSVQWQKDDVDIWQRLFFNRSAKQVIIDKDIYFPVYANQHFFGAFKVSRSILLPENELSQLFDLMELIITSGLKAIVHNGNLQMLEKRMLADNQDCIDGVEDRKVIPFGASERTKHWFFGPMSFTSAPPPIVGQVIIECADLARARRFAVDLNSSTLGHGMISLSEFENDFFTAEELRRLSDMALFIPDITKLSTTQMNEIQKFLDGRHDKHSLSLVIATPKPLEELFANEECPLNLLNGRFMHRVRMTPEHDSQGMLRELLDKFWKLDFMVSSES
jgi:hypothetical protein